MICCSATQATLITSTTSTGVPCSSHPLPAALHHHAIAPHTACQGFGNVKTVFTCWPTTVQAPSCLQPATPEPHVLQCFKFHSLKFNILLPSCWCFGCNSPCLLLHACRLRSMSGKALMTRVWRITNHAKLDSLVQVRLNIHPMYR